MSKAVVIHEYGGPEVMKIEDVEVGKPGTGQVKVRNRAIGLNFIKVYNRTDLYPLQIPAGIAKKGACVINPMS